MYEVVKVENERVSVIVDKSTGTIIDIYDKVTNVHHLSVRHPELTLGTIGMGILTTHPFIGRPTVQAVDDKLIKVSGSLGKVKLDKEIMLTNHGVLVDVNVDGSDAIKESMHVACGTGGFWSESPGALYNCRYFVRFLDDIGSLDEYSSFMVKPPTSGFKFNKHTYTDRYFPDLKWVAFINADSKVGMVVRCLNPCVGIAEDQLFDVNLELIKRCGNEDCKLSYELILIHGLSRVDHVSDSFIVGVEIPDLIVPGSKVNGNVKIYALEDLKMINVSGRVSLIKSIAPMGRRGYVLDRTIRSEKHYDVGFLNNAVSVSRGNVGEVALMINTLSWDPEYYSQSMPLLELNINGETVRRAFSVNEDLEEALELVKERNPHLINSIDLSWNDYIESFFDEKSSTLPIYELAVEHLDSARRLIDNSSALCSAPLQLLNNYLNSPQGRLTTYGLYTSALSERILKLAVSSICTGVGLNDTLALMNTLVNEFERGRLIHWFNGLHGGAGSAGLFNLVLAFDLLEGKLPRDLDNRLRLMFRWAQDELIKITNAWTYPLGNWELTEALALLSISLKFNFRNSDVGIAKALSVFKHALKRGFLNDGAWSELSAAYHMSALNNSVWASELLRLLNVNLYEYAHDGTPTLLKAIRYIWGILDENYNMPALEDSGFDKPNPDPFIILGIRYNDPMLVNIGLALIKMGQYIRSPLTLIALSNAGSDLLSNANNVKPTHDTLTIFNDSGRFIYRFREGYDYFILDYGPHGGWHGHPDKLSFELHVNGEPIIVDSGADNYYGVNHWSWHRRSIAHNTITLEDKDQLEARGELIEYRVLNNGVEALFRANTYPGVIQTRLINIVENTLYFIKDTIVGSGTFRFNLNAMGSLRGITENYPYMIMLSTGNTKYSITLPNRPNILRGMRGHGIETNYIYYEENITNSGVLWALISVGESKPNISGCLLTVNNMEFDIC